MDYGYSTTSYGAQGGNQGGGFMPGSQGEGSASAKRSYKSDSLRPVTIKQLLTAHHPTPDAEHFMIDGAETTQVTFVGQVRNISSQTTNVTYKFDDGTGSIEVKVWVDPDAGMDMEMNDGTREAKKYPVEQQYARVFGRLKAFNSKRHVGAIVVRPIEDYNEIPYHLLEATLVHLHFTKGSLESLQGANGQPEGQAAQQNGAGDRNSALAGMGPGAKKMFECLHNSPQTNEGLHAQDIASRTGMELPDVYKASDELIGLGKVYTTIDDHTWALLEV